MSVLEGMESCSSSQSLSRLLVAKAGRNVQVAWELQNTDFKWNCLAEGEIQILFRKASDDVACWWRSVPIDIVVQSFDPFEANSSCSLHNVPETVLYFSITCYNWLAGLVVSPQVQLVLVIRLASESRSRSSRRGRSWAAGDGLHRDNKIEISRYLYKIITNNSLFQYQNQRWSAGWLRRVT